MKHTIKTNKMSIGDGSYWYDTPDLPEIGKIYQFAIYEKSGHDWLEWFDSPDMIKDGIPGNSNPTIRRHYGWRGTYNDVACYGVGVGVVRKIVKKEFRKTVRYHIYIDIDKAIVD